MAALETTRQNSVSCTGLEKDEFKQHMKTRPSVRSLTSELHQIVDWQLLLLKLGMEKHEIDKIERNFPQDVDRQKLEALALWLRETPDACWKYVIAALFDMKENTLATELTRKYNWKDPRVYVTRKYLCAPPYACLTAKPISDDLPCRRFIQSHLTGNQQFFIFDPDSTQRMNQWSALKRTKHFTRLINTKLRDAHTLLEFLKSIEESEYKRDFKVGLEARFGKVYWKFNPRSVLPANSTRAEWFESRLLRKSSFNTEVEESDVEQLFKGREQLGKARITLKLNFIVVGQDEGIYSAVIATYESGELFYLDAVYREPALEKKVRIDFSLAGRKYDFRIGDCSEYIVLENESTTPYKIATTIVNSLCRLPGRKLHLIVHGKSPNGESSWIVNYIRQRVQRQYKWKPERRWALARYDIDVFDCDTNETVKVKGAPLNTAVDIPEFDYSRKEVELWGTHIFPKDVNKTHPSREKYYYIEGVDGVKLPGGEFRKPYNWTADSLMKDFEEFLGDAFKIAHILDGSPY